MIPLFPVVDLEHKLYNHYTLILTYSKRVGSRKKKHLKLIPHKIRFSSNTIDLFVSYECFVHKNMYRYINTYIFLSPSNGYKWGKKQDWNGICREQGAKADVQMRQEIVQVFWKGLKGQQAIPSINNSSRHLDYGCYTVICTSTNFTSFR